jgi:hypothetical protein
MRQIYGTASDIIGGTINCHDYVQIGNITKTDQRVSGDQAEVIAQIDLTFKRSFHPGSTRSDQCAGGMWRGPGFEQDFLVGHTLRVTKTFSFVKFQSGWRCQTKLFSPADGGHLLGEIKDNASAEEIARDFGLMSERSVDCNKPPGHENQRQKLMIENGVMHNKVDIGDKVIDGYSVSSAKRIGVDTILIHATGGAGEFDILLIRQNDRIRAMSSQLLSNGVYMIKDGIFVATRQETPWVSICSAQK